MITDPIEMVKAQALGKARCANDVPDGSIVLGADTIVQPSSEKDDLSGLLLYAMNKKEQPSYEDYGKNT